MRARVLFDARPGTASTTGIGRYARTMASIVRELEAHDGRVLGRSAADIQLPSRSPTDEEVRLPALLERESVVVYHSPLFHLPAKLPCRSVITVHDAIPAARPELVSPGFLELWKEAAVAARRADRVVCPSESAAREVAQHLGIDAAKIRVVPEAPDPIFRELAEPRPEPPGFLLVVGSIEERKGPRILLEALARIPRDAGTRPLAAFVGPDGGFDLARAAEELGVDVRAHGVVTDERLVRLYNSAAAVVFASLHEGFGLPVVEAFACGTPVIASRTASIPEVAGDAALLVEPGDPDALADAIREVIGVPGLRHELRSRGLRRLEQFTRARVTESLTALYSELVP